MPRTNEDLHDPLRGHLVNLSRAIDQKYEVSSYVWGKDYKSRCIKIDNHCLPTENLYVALVHLRLSNSSAAHCVWVDAICIDQSNKAEAECSHQVLLIRKIYHSARRVRVWLGIHQQRGGFLPGWSTQDHVLGDLSQSNPTDYREFKKDDHEYWQELLSSPWYYRVWVLQELANGKDIIVCFGRTEYTWPYLVRQARRFREHSGPQSTLLTTVTQIENMDN
jgi:hypothetical protein